MTRAGSFFGLHLPFLELLGARADHWEQGRAVVSLELRKDHANSWGSAHGGVLTSLLDVAMGGAAMTVDSHASGVVTVNLSVTFLRSGAGVLVAEGRLMKGGRSLVFCEGEVRDRDGEVVAKAVGTFKVKRRVEAGSGGRG
jgi:uncharacterized protein (TIGR00369 family)